MERLSDAEDFIPPTPRNPKKQFPILGKNLSPSKNLKQSTSSKLPKNTGRMSKRKKSSGVSPNFKKFKDKTNQLTLFNYLKKDIKTSTDDVQSYPAKIKLFSEFDVNSVTTSNCSNTVKCDNRNAIACDAKALTDCKTTTLHPHSSKMEIINQFEPTSITSSSCCNKLQFDNENATACDTDCNIEVSIDSTSNPTVSFSDNDKLLSEIELTNSTASHCNNKVQIDIKNTVVSNTDTSVANISKENFSEFKTSNTAKASCVLERSIYEGDCNTKSKPSTDGFLSTNQICNDVGNLSLDFDDRNEVSDYSLSECVTQATCDLIKKPCESNLSLDVSKCTADMEQSLSWMDDFEWKGCDIEKENCSEASATSNQENSNAGNKMLYEVKEISRNTNNEVKLILKTPSSISSEVKTCVLKGFWADTLINIGDTVHVLKEFEKGSAVIDNHSGFLVVNPDFLLSSTAVVSTLFCMRKAALNHVLPNWSSGNDVMMIGNLVHDIFQQAVNGHVISKNEIIVILEKVLKKQDNLLALSCQDTSEAEIKEKVIEYVPSIVNWIQRHCAFKGMKASNNLQITHVQAIEENVWCPKYGIKGKIDLTVQASFRDQAVTKVMPLELKTGRASYSAEHTGQINLYTLMMEERSKELSDGLLLYLKDVTNMKQVSADHNARRGLIQLRNELAFYTWKWILAAPQKNDNDDIEDCHLPKPINNKKFCGKCPYLLPCTVYQRAFSEEKVLGNDHVMKSLITATTSHLNSSHLEYFIHWSNLLLLESTSATVTNAFWLEESAKREKKGMCLSWLNLDCNSRKDHNVDGIYNINRFQRSKDSPLTAVFTNVGLREGDYVAISNQNNFDEVAVAMGYLIKLEEEFVDVATERNLCMEAKFKDYVFRIDKQVSNSATACIRNNLVCFMDNENQASKLRNFIIDKQEPQFTKSLPKDVVLSGRSILKGLNKIQQRVVLKALMAQDYFIIKGMPGTGKTSTIVALVRLLVSMGISVFLSSYTHSAIDNILLKLKEHLEFVRIGQEARIHPSLKKFSFQTLTSNFTTADQFKVFMKEQKVVAATCLGINHAIFKIRKFDVCIVDEASQINQIACIGPLFHAEKFILVGDDKQLPPLVVNEKARDKGMQESLLQRLWHPNNSMELIIQYRMNKEIMRLCNELTYSGMLQCGSESIAEAVLQLNEQNVAPFTPEWVMSVMQSDLQKSVIFLNTNQINAGDMEKGQGQEKNTFETNLVMDLLSFLLKCNVPESHIGIITPYRRQVDLIGGKLKNLRLNEIEVNTVDQYQGRDKDVIIISCVKCSKLSPDNRKKGNILDDAKRLNVGISRAKRKLILIGCKSTLLLYKPFERLINILTAEQFVNIPENYLSTL